MTDTLRDTAYELLAKDLGSMSLPTTGDTHATFRPLEGEVNDEYRAALTEKLDVVFGKSNVTVGAAAKGNGIDVTIKRGAGVRQKLAEIVSRNNGMDY